MVMGFDREKHAQDALHGKVWSGVRFDELEQF